ncbi:MAG: hypothetical protein KAR79_02600, partial [Simkaniaceae bacterium]|nr:hypothetical protein [Simkaniaceae bacterium]
FQVPVINTEKETEISFFAAKKAGVERIDRLDCCKMAGEDFGEYLKLVPGCYFLMGAGIKTPALHTSLYDFPDGILGKAAAVMLQTLLFYGR